MPEGWDGMDVRRGLGWDELDGCEVGDEMGDGRNQ